MRPYVAHIFIWLLISYQFVIMLGMHSLSDIMHSFLKLFDVSDVAINKLMFICYFVVHSLCVHCIIGLAFCHKDMTTKRGRVS